MLVIKIGGGAAIGEGGFRNFAQDLAGFAEPVVIVPAKVTFVPAPATLLLGGVTTTTGAMALVR